MAVKLALEKLQSLEAIVATGQVAVEFLGLQAQSLCFGKFEPSVAFLGCASRQLAGLAPSKH